MTNPAYLERWEALTADADFTTPEGRWKLDVKLRAFLAGVEPLGLRHHYEHFFRQMRAKAYQEFDPK